MIVWRISSALNCAVFCTTVVHDDMDRDNTSGCLVGFSVECLSF